MKDAEVRCLDTILKVRQFGTEHAQAFPAGTRGAEILAELNNVIAEVQGYAVQQSSSTRGAMESTTLKAVARRALKEDMKAISRTAHAMALTMPGLEEKFRLPRNAGEQVWLAAGRSFAQDALPLKDEFIRRGHPADFVEDLNADIAELEGAMNRKAEKANSRTAATAAIDEAIERGMDLVDELDAVVLNVFRGDPATLAGWASASHTQRAPRRRPEEPAQPNP